MWISVALLSLVAPGAQMPDEPTQEEDAFAKGVEAFVTVQQDWRAKRKCVSCHTTGWGLAAQPVIAPKSDEVTAGRAFAQDYLKKYIDQRVKPKGQHGSVEGMVSTAAFLALSDARSSKSMHAVTRESLDHAWSLLDASGTWEAWLQCNWPPFESDAEFGPTLMLVALGELRAVAELSDADLKAVARLSSYLRKNPPLSLHAKAMRIWAARAWPDSLHDPDSAELWRKELLEAQGEDGGWSMASLAGPAWKRDGGEEQTRTSESYATAFAVYVLMRTGVDGGKVDRTRELSQPVNDGLHWLRAQQREGGDWFTRSPRRDREHYISRAATAFALMALAEAQPRKSK